MAKNYEQLFQKAFPKVSYNISESDSIDYEIEYKDITETDKLLSIVVDYKRITPLNRIKIAYCVLNETLCRDIQTISKYINMENKIFVVQNIKKEPFSI
jgi:hypothetical protein